MKRHEDSKFNICTEGVAVNAAAGYYDVVPTVESCEENVRCKESKLMLAVIDAGNMRKAQSY
jgi:uncharacterized protein with GYD domain